MRSYRNVFKDIISYETRERAVLDVCKTRKNDRLAQKFIQNKEKTITDSLKWIMNFEAPQYTPKTIIEPSSGKERVIIVPSFEELVVQRCVVSALMPMFTKGMYEHTYASIPGRGAVEGRKFLRRWIDNNPKNFKYCLKLDIRKFFDNVDHDVLMNKLNKYIKDNQAIALLQEIIDTTEKGIPLGFFTSQWFANWLLQDLDHYIKEKLKVKHYIRYMDDMVLGASNKKKLHEVKIMIEKYLNDRYHLELKSNWALFRFDYIRSGKHYGRDIDFMGFRFFRNKTILRKNIMYNMTRKARKISKKEKPTIYELKQFMSYIGWLKYTDSYNMYIKWIKPYVNIQYCKRRISNYDRRMARERAMERQV